MCPAAAVGGASTADRSLFGVLGRALAPRTFSVALGVEIWWILRIVVRRRCKRCLAAALACHWPFARRTTPRGSRPSLRLRELFLQLLRQSAQSVALESVGHVAQAVSTVLSRALMAFARNMGPTFATKARRSQIQLLFSRHF